MPPLVAFIASLYNVDIYCPTLLQGVKFCILRVFENLHRIQLLVENKETIITSQCSQEFTIKYHTSKYCRLKA